jgi:AcrR family transcriptional regulator
MPEPKESKKAASNRTRTEATRSLLIEVARRCFAEKGYADTGTPEIVAEAGLTRGALYHHFIDKLELFRAVLERESERVASQIASDTFESRSPLDAMLDGADAFFDAMSVPGRARLLLLEGPAVLGVAAMEEMDRRTGQDELRQGLKLVLGNAPDANLSLDALSSVLSAAFDRAALALVSGENIDDYRVALRTLLLGIPGMNPNENVNGQF